MVSFTMIRATGPSISVWHGSSGCGGTSVPVTPSVDGGSASTDVASVTVCFGSSTGDYGSSFQRYRYTLDGRDPSGQTFPSGPSVVLASPGTYVVRVRGFSAISWASTTMSTLMTYYVTLGAPSGHSGA